jgi:hypothetical protein
MAKTHTWEQTARVERCEESISRAFVYFFELSKCIKRLFKIKRGYALTDSTTESHLTTLTIFPVVAASPHFPSNSTQMRPSLPMTKSSMGLPKSKWQNIDVDVGDDSVVRVGKEKTNIAVALCSWISVTQEAKRREEDGPHCTEDDIFTCTRLE